MKSVTQFSNSIVNMIIVMTLKHLHKCYVNTNFYDNYAKINNVVFYIVKLISTEKLFQLFSR